MFKSKLIGVLTNLVKRKMSDSSVAYRTIWYTEESRLLSTASINGNFK